jgi:hypothetical protein
VIAFYTDENVDQRIIHGLRRRGVDVLTAQEAGLLGTIPDVQHLEFAIARGRALLTADTDLLEIADQWNAQGRPHQGVVFYHQRWSTVGHVVREAHGIAHGLNPDDVRSRVIFISWDRRPQSK